MFSNVPLYCSTSARSRQVQGYVHTPDDIVELTEAVTTAHLDYARQQVEFLWELGFTDDLGTAW